MLGSLVAAVAGILITPFINFDTSQPTLLIIDAPRGRPLIGGLVSLPLTVLGGFILGLLETYRRSGFSRSGFSAARRAAVILRWLLVVPQPAGVRGGRQMTSPTHASRASWRWPRSRCWRASPLGFDVGFKFDAGLAGDLGVRPASLVLLTGYVGHDLPLPGHLCRVGAYAAGMMSATSHAGLLVAVAVAWPPPSAWAVNRRTSRAAAARDHARVVTAPASRLSSTAMVSGPRFRVVHGRERRLARRRLATCSASRWTRRST